MNAERIISLTAVALACGAFAENRVVDLGNGERAAIFDEAGEFTFTVPGNITGTAQILVVGGGGGGGGISGGGGGGGQVVLTTGVELTPGDVISGSVGAGGGGGSGGASGGTGKTTTLASALSELSASAIGGGGGAGSWSSKSGSPGACGGGAGGNGTDVKAGGAATVEGGHAGGSTDGAANLKRWGGGGGGWLADGKSIAEGGNGGAGYTTSISGESKMYAYGGGGCVQGKGGAGTGYGDGWTSSTAAQPGEDGTGGGGGGGQTNTGGAAGGTGGSGTVIIRYTIDETQLTVDFTTSTTNGFAPYTATFTASADGALEGLEFTWNFGDGSPSSSTSGATISHTYTAGGLYSVSVTATSTAGSAIKTVSDLVVVDWPVIYADASSQNPVAPYVTPETAAASFSDALAAATVDGQVLSVAPGVYTGVSNAVVSRAIKVLGTGSDPSQTVFTNSATAGKCWVLKVSNSNALVANLSIAGGRITENLLDHGACLTITSGVVSNCIVRGGYINNIGANTMHSLSAGVFVKGSSSLFTHSIVEECNVARINAWGNISFGAGASVMGSGRIENCLFRNINTTCGDVVTLMAGSLVNCTIADCTVKTWVHDGASALTDKCYGLCLTNGISSVTNVVIANVRAGNDASENRAVGASAANLESSLINCATDTEEPLNSTCVTGSKATFFKGSGYEPRLKGPLVDAGAEVSAFASGVDLAGNSRVFGKGIDIGCYECQVTPGFVILVR